MKNTLIYSLLLCLCLTQWSGAVMACCQNAAPTVIEQATTTDAPPCHETTVTSEQTTHKPLASAEQSDCADCSDCLQTSVVFNQTFNLISTPQRHAPPPATAVVQLDLHTPKDPPKNLLI